MSDTPKLDGQISIADHREAMRMAAVGYVRELDAMRTARNAATRTAEMLNAALMKEAALVDEARRQVEVLLAKIANLGECPTGDDCLASIDMPARQSDCKKCWLEWAAQQAKEGGGK
jgi:hypothetical protein